MDIANLLKMAIKFEKEAANEDKPKAEQPAVQSASKYQPGIIYAPNRSDELPVFDNQVTKELQQASQKNLDILLKEKQLKNIPDGSFMVVNIGGNQYKTLIINHPYTDKWEKDPTTGKSVLKRLPYNKPGITLKKVKS